jgi:4-diphosphocytidyl-2-C-methyl-D-erythritol kinase
MSPAFQKRAASWRSPAKVNVCLRVVGRRDDGYHLLDSIFVPIDLHDDVRIEIASVTPRGEVSIAIEADDPTVPSDGTNLAARAAAALLAACGLGGEVQVRLTKRIPAGAGLGGGSSNAATVLQGLTALLDLDVAPARLAEIGLRLGADVPFFLQRGAARVRGIGEHVQPLPGWGDVALVIAIPPVQISTPWVFKTFREMVPLGSTQADAAEPAALAAGEPVGPELLVNDLERVVLPAFPAVAALKERLRAAGATAAVMSGSGSAVLGAFPSRSAAEAAAGRLRAEDPALRVHAVGTSIG